MKKLLDVVLHTGTDKQQFIDSFDQNKVNICNILECIPYVLSVWVDENYVEEFIKDSRIKIAGPTPSIEAIDPR